MKADPHLSQAEWEALKEVGTGPFHAPISPDHAKKLLALKLIYSLLGSYRITTPGRDMLQCSATDKNSVYAGEAISSVDASVSEERRTFRWGWLIWTAVVVLAVLYSLASGLLPR